MVLKETLIGHNSAIYKLLIHDGLLYSASGDGMVGTWDISTLQPSPFSVKVGQPVFAMLIQSAQLLIGQGSGNIHVIDLDSKKEIRNLQFHKKGVFDILYNPYTEQYYSLGGDGVLSISALDFKLLLQLPLSGNKLRKALVSPDGKHLMVAGSDGDIHILETGYMNELAVQNAHEGGTYAMLWLDEKNMVTGGRDGHIRFWNFTSDGLKESNAIPAHNYAIYDLVKISDKRFASASRDKMVKVWDIDHLSNPERLIDTRSTSHSNSVNNLTWCEGNLYSAGDDRAVKVWA